MTQFIITSWDFSSEIAKKHQSEPEQIIADNWYHCQRDAEPLRGWLKRNTIPEAIIDSLLADDSRPRFEQFSEECFLIILRGINLNEGSEPDDMLSLRILWFKGAIISTRKVPSLAVSNLLDKLEKGIGPRSLPSLLLGMANGINSIISDFLSPIETKIDELEEKTKPDLKDLNSLYSRLLRLRRYLKPQRYVFEDLIAADISALKSQQNHFKNCLDTIARMNESIEFYIDQINLYLSNLNQQQSELMNRNTYLFSIIAGIFLPAGFFTGLLGVNVGGVPGVENPMAFTVFCVVLTIIAIVEVVILKMLRFI